MPRKKSERTRAKDTAWRWFSKYIRLRDCISTTGFKDQGKCVTCGGYFPFSELQAGHAIGGRNDAVLFDEKLVNAQCGRCNKSFEYGGLGGNYAKYHLWYIHKYGEQDFEAKVFISDQAVKIPTPELREIANRYRLAFNKLNEK
jgi:hypothetical protein